MIIGQSPNFRRVSRLFKWRNSWEHYWGIKVMQEETNLKNFKIVSG